ncbi:MAG: hypothetical protein R6U88_07310 [Candidatus Bipolaricaulota bacterium]
MAEATICREILISTPDRVGLLAEISQLIAAQTINILAVCVRVAQGEAQIRVVTDAPTYTLDALRKAEFSVDERDVVLVELPHRPGLLRRVTDTLARQDLDIHDLYATVTSDSDQSLVVFSCSHNGKAVQLLRDR